MSLFSQIRASRLSRSKFNLSHEKKLSFNMGELIPIMCNEVVPGDKFRVNTELLIRLAPLISPMMHRVNVFTHYFFVPNRLIFDEWEKFIGGGQPGDSVPIWPHIEANDIKNQQGKGTLCDYLGIPPFKNSSTVLNNVKFSALPFRAYQLICDEYYIDQNLGTKSNCGGASGYVSNVGDHAWLRKRAWEKDYFTSALPWAQKSSEPVSLPTDIDYKSQSDVRLVGGTNPSAGDIKAGTVGELLDVTGAGARIENIESLGITIDDLRKSVRLQEWFEKMARGGSKYREILLNMFGIKSSDHRMMVPEYIGGGKSPVVISEVLNTAGDPDQNPLRSVGEMAGHGIAVGANHGFKRFFEEHGFVVGIMSVLPRTCYQDGIDRMWSREDRFDYYWKQFANLGEQEVKNKEIVLDTFDGVWDNDAAFGYQSKYAEYKHAKDTVHGNFRDDLSYWHMGRLWTSGKPALNETFIEADPTNRIFAVTDPNEHKLYAQIYHKFSALRPMPYFGTPRL